MELRTGRRQDSGAKVPLDVDDFAAACKVLREEVLAEADAGRLSGVAQGMQLTVEIQRTDEGASGLLKGRDSARLE